MSRLDLPCEICGADGACACPPCPCVFCRYDRGEVTYQERQMVEARARALARHDARLAARAASK